MNRVALTMLFHDKAKYFGIIFGISLASLLMVHQATIFIGILGRTWSLVQDMHEPEVFVMDPETEFLEDIKPMPEQTLYRLRGVEGVQWATPLYKGPLRVKLPNGKFRTAQVIGVDDTSLIPGPQRMLQGDLQDLRQPDTVVVDELDVGNLLSWRNEQGVKQTVKVGDSIELNERRVRIVGICKNTRPFISQPALYCTYSTARRFAPPERNHLSLVAVRAQPGQDIAALCERIRAQTGMAAYPKWDFGWMTVSYYLRNTGIPVNFGITILLGIIVGAAITGQTFYLFTLDNLRYFAAFKAMGAGNGLIARMTFIQAGVVGFIGYGLGVGGAALFFVSFWGSELDFTMYWQPVVLAGCVVLSIIAVAAAFSLRRVFTLEAAVVFRA